MGRRLCQIDIFSFLLYHACINQAPTMNTFPHTSNKTSWQTIIATLGGNTTWDTLGIKGPQRMYHCLG